MLEVDRAMVEEFGIPPSLYAIPSLGLDVVPVFAAGDIVRIATT